MLVIVIVPNAPAKIWPTLVTATPSIVTVAGLSRAVKAIVPVVVSLSAAPFEPVGKPASSTEVPASPALGRSSVVPLSAMLIVSVVVDVSPSPSVMV